MKQRRWTVLVIIAVLAIGLSGCMGKGRGVGPIRFQGKISGRVYDENGKGLAGAKVMSRTLRLVATTDSDGRYTLLDVPDGTHVVVATKEGYGPASSASTSKTAVQSMEQLTQFETRDGSAEEKAALAAQVLEDATLAAAGPASMSVTIQGGNARRADLFLAPRPATEQSVVRLAMRPQSGTKFSAGTTIGVEVDVFYNVHHEAILMASLTRNRTPLGGDWTIVSPEGSNHTLRFDFVMPHWAEEMSLQLALLDPANGHVLATTTSPVHYVAKEHSNPVPPRLDVVNYDASEITVSWSGGTLVDFQRFELYRNEGKSPINRWSDKLIATITDPSVDSLVDTDFIYGDVLRYGLYMVTTTGRYLGGIDDAVVNVDTSGGQHAMITAPNTVVDLAADPVRDRLYIAMRSTNDGRIGFLSTRNDMFEKTIPLECRPWQIVVAGDGSNLFGSCLNENMVAQIDLFGTGDVTYHRDIVNPTRLAYVPDAHKLYVASYDSEYKRVVTAIDLTTGSRSYHFYDIDAGFILSEDGTTLVVRSPSATTGGTTIGLYDPVDLTLRASWEDNYYLTVAPGMPVLNPERDEAYIGNHVFRFSTGEHLEQLGGSVQAVSRDGRYLFGPWDSQALSVYGWNGLTWSLFARLPTRVNKVIALAQDEQKLYTIRGHDRYIYMFDLSAMDM